MTVRQVKSIKEDSKGPDAEVTKLQYRMNKGSELGRDQTADSETEAITIRMDVDGWRKGCEDEYPMRKE
jgi:hypothetical protein